MKKIVFVANSLVNGACCSLLSLTFCIWVGSANIGPSSRIHSFTAISHNLTFPSTHKLPAIVTTSYHSCINRVCSHHVYWEPKTQTENSRCSHTWHRGDARETIARLEANLNKLEDEAGNSDTKHSLQHNGYSNISTRPCKTLENVTIMDIVDDTELQEHPGQTGK